MPKPAEQFVPGRRPSQRPGRAGSKRDLNRIQRTRELCEAALELFLELGLEGVTVDEITKGAGIAKGSFYRYFDDKSQLVAALFAPMSGAVRAAMDRAAASLDRATTRRDLAHAYETLARDVVQAMLPEPRLAKLYLQESRGPATGARKPIREFADEVVRRAVEMTHVAHDHGLLRDLPPNVTALAVIGAAENLFFHYAEGMNFGDPSQATQVLIAMVLDGMGANRSSAAP